MANTVSIQTMLDGPRNTVIKVDVAMDGSGDIVAPYTIINPALLSSYGPANGSPPTKVRVDLIDWDIQDGLAITLLWDGAGSAPIWRLTGRSMEKAFHVGGLQNNADQPTGKITMTTSSNTSAPSVASFKLHCVKQP